MCDTYPHQPDHAIVRRDGEIQAMAAAGILSEVMEIEHVSYIQSDPRPQGPSKKGEGENNSKSIGKGESQNSNPASTDLGAKD